MDKKIAKGIVKRGDSYRFTVCLGYDIYRKQIRKTTTWKPPENISSAKADRMAEEEFALFRQRVKGAVSLDENQRFSELCDWYYSMEAPNKLRDSTLSVQKGFVDTYILPAIGNVKIKEITVTRLDMFFNQLSKDGGVRKIYSLKDVNLFPKGTRKNYAHKIGVSPDRIYFLSRGGTVSFEIAEKISNEQGRKISEIFIEKKAKQGLSPRTVATIRQILSAILNTAVRKEIILKNPAEKTIIPKYSVQAKDFFERDEIVELLEISSKLDNLFLRTAITTLIHTGFRSGELLGLMWSDINSETGEISVNRTLQHRNGKYYFGEPKTKTSERVVEVPLEVINLLFEQKNERQKRFEIENITPINDEMVFLGVNGGYANNCYLNTIFKNLLKKHNLPNCHIHDLRHAHASLLVNAKIPTVQIAAQLGHTNPNTTRQIYEHSFSNRQAVVKSAITQQLLNPTDENAP